MEIIPVNFKRKRYIHFTMKLLFFLSYLLITLIPAKMFAQESGSPDDHLPPNIKRITQFGERADWSRDGKKILFLEKTFGDVFEFEIATGKITLLTGYFYHGGFTRALYLANDDILLSGCTSFDAANPGANRTEKAELWVLDKNLSTPPVRLGTKCFEGPAVSRKNMRMAWTIMDKQYPGKLRPGQFQIFMADIIYNNGIPELANRKLLLDNLNTDFGGEIETQNFVPPDETRLTFSAYGYKNSEVMVLDLQTGKVSDISNAVKPYDEPEGIFPDGQNTCVESDRQNLKGSGSVDIWKLRLDGSGEMTRLTFFSDYPGYKSSNPVISDDGRYMAFQEAYSKDQAGVGHGIFIMDLLPDSK